MINFFSIRLFFIQKIANNTNMSRREELEKEIANVQKVMDEAPAGTPKEVVDAWRKEYDSLSFELNNLYDDYTEMDEID